jgi:hypothetical protein
LFLHDKFLSDPLAFNASPEDIYYKEKGGYSGNPVRDMGDFIEQR